MTGRRARTCLATTLAVIVAGVVTPVSAARLERSSTVKVSGSLHAVTDTVTDTALCVAQGGEYAPGPLDYAYSGTSSYAGTFQGTARFCGRSAGAVNPDGSVPFVETDTFTGTVSGCGRGPGTVTYNVHGVIYASVDPATKGVPAEEDWRVVVRSVSGGLAAMRSGSGHDHATINPDASIDADFTGTVTCLVRRSKPAPTGGARHVRAFNTDNEGIQPASASCSADTGTCSGRTVGRTVWTGDFAGTASYVLDFTPQADGSLAYEGVEHMSVTVVGRGWGTFDLRITDGVYDPKQVLLAAGQPVINHDRWSVVPGSGTGVLGGLAGYGTEAITDFSNGKSRADLSGSLAGP